MLGHSDLRVTQQNYAKPTSGYVQEVADALELPDQRKPEEP